MKEDLQEIEPTEFVPCSYCGEMNDRILFVSPHTGVVICEHCVKALAKTLRAIMRKPSEVCH